MVTFLWLFAISIFLISPLIYKEKKVTIGRIVHIMAGFMVLLSVALTHFVHPNWVWMTVFVGVNLFQSGFTRFCPPAILLKKLGVPEA